jgi:signal peptidase I
VTPPPERPTTEGQDPWGSPLPPDRVDDDSGSDGWRDSAWPTPADVRTPESESAPPGEAAFGVPQPLEPPPAPPPEPPRKHSWNPLTRLTAGLPRGLRIAIDWIVTIIGAIAIVLLVKAYIVNPYRIPSSSMETTLHCAEPAPGCEASFSDRVLANRFIYHLRDPRRGEIIVFNTPPEALVKCGAGGTFVKRLIGLPGERIEIRLERGDGYVYIDGERLEEPYLTPERRSALNEMAPRTIPDDHYFMMGDNRAQSCDSREWGAVPRENLIGKVFATYWPPNRISLH